MVLICYHNITYCFAQFSSLDEANNVHPNAVWWIKGDGCDVVEGLGESTKKIWTGDIDVADGELQKSYDAYLQRLEFVGKIGMPPRNHRPELIDDLRAVLTLICNDLETISNGNNSIL